MATQYDNCLRRCEPCGIGASNAADPQAVTYIHRDPLGNIPIESREAVTRALGQALNVRNRGSKRRRFGFSTSEDVVSLQVRMRGILQPTIHFDDLQRIGHGHQDLREQSVRIERDRGEQLVELFGFED